MERLLETARAELLHRLNTRFVDKKMAAWVYMVRAGILMDTERFEMATASALFPTAAGFCLEPQNAATYATAKRGLKGDYDRMMVGINATEPDDREKRQFTLVYGEPGAL